MELSEWDFWICINKKRRIPAEDDLCAEKNIKFFHMFVKHVSSACLAILKFHHFFFIWILNLEKQSDIEVIVRPDYVDVYFYHG